MALAPLILTEKVREPSAVPSPALPPSNVPLHLLLDRPLERSRPHWLRIIAASLLLHLVFFFAAIRLPSFIPLDQPSHRTIVRRVPLYLPPDILTQREPNRQTVSKSIDLADLHPSRAQQPRAASPPPTHKQLAAPQPAPTQQPVHQQAAKATPPAQPNATKVPEAPKVAMNQPPAPPPPGIATGLPPTVTPPPPAQSPFQNVGSEAPLSSHPTLTPPKSPLQASPSELAQTAPPPGRHSADDDNSPAASPRVPGSLDQSASPHAAVELQSDPQGADFKPYLARILAIVRANWRRVVPESARQGALRGRTVMEFIINRDGSIPKIVTADSSGSDPLDRAALAGLSMSNPLPPLPADFKGFQVRLAFTFTYNLPTQ